METKKKRKVFFSLFFSQLLLALKKCELFSSSLGKGQRANSRFNPFFLRLHYVTFFFSFFYSQSSFIVTFYPVVVFFVEFLVVCESRVDSSTFNDRRIVSKSREDFELLSVLALSFLSFLSRTLQTNENFRVKRGERIRTTRRHSAHLTARSNYKAEEWRNGSLTQLFGTFGLAPLLLLVFAICLLCLLPLFLLVTSSRGPPARPAVRPPTFSQILLP